MANEQMQTQAMGPKQDAAPLTRDERQKKMFPAELLGQQRAVVVGTGAIGRQVATMLAAMGVGGIIMYDPDTVGIENMANQGWRPDQIGMAKTDALAIDLHALNPAVHLTGLTTRFQRMNNVPADVVFSCVDDMDTRKLIAETCRDAWAKLQPGTKSPLFVDGRMAAEVMRVLTVVGPSEWERYLATVFSNERAYTGSCTAQATIYCAYAIAARMVLEFAKWLRRVPTTPDELENLLTGDRMVPEPPKTEAVPAATA